MITIEKYFDSDEDVDTHISASSAGEQFTISIIATDDDPIHFDLTMLSRQRFERFLRTVAAVGAALLQGHDQRPAPDKEPANAEATGEDGDRLLRQLSAANARIEQLKGYAQHKPGCLARTSGLSENIIIQDHVCTCGLENILNEKV